MFGRWPIYALAAGSVAALFLQQASLHVGPLRASQPFLVIVDPMVSIALSIWLFGEHFTDNTAALAVAAVGFAVMCAGIVVLTQTAPATMAADIPEEQSLPELIFFLSWLSLQDRFLSGAVLLRVEQHEVAARGAFDPDGEGQMIIVILPEGQIVTSEGRPAIEPERGKGPDAERVRRAADGTSPQAELLKCLGDFGDESLTPSHAPLHLPPAQAILMAGLALDPGFMVPPLPF